jgi:hypothetical protein
MRFSHADVAGTVFWHTSVSISAQYALSTGQKPAQFLA